MMGWTRSPGQAACDRQILICSDMLVQKDPDALLAANFIN